MKIQLRRGCVTSILISLPDFDHLEDECRKYTVIFMCFVVNCCLSLLFQYQFVFSFEKQKLFNGMFIKLKTK